VIRCCRLLAALLVAALATSARADTPWAHALLARLSLEEKAAQVQMVPIRAASEDLGGGGVVMGRGDVRRLVAAIERLQQVAKVPLLVASDLDWSGDGAAPNGIPRLPALMALGAAGSEKLAQRVGRAAAREARSLGVQMMLAPVLDVNTNPDNPIINARSFGEDAQAVARLGSAFIRGVRSAGVLATAKHFPGHGATALNSHRALPTVPGDRARLDAVELAPFRTAIAAGVDAVMAGHLAVPALDPSGTAATASKRIISGVLRGELAFGGLVLTDAMGMRAVTDAFEPGEAAVRALAAGADMVLASPDPRRAAAAIVEAVRTGRLPRERLDAAVLRVLEAKASAGLDREARPPLAERGRAEAESDAAAMRELAERSITLVRNDRRILPLAPGRPLLHITIFAGFEHAAQDAHLRSELRRRAPEAELALVDTGTGAPARERLIARAASAETVIVSIFLPITADQVSLAMPEDLAQFVRRLADSSAALVVVSFGSPYFLRQFPRAPAYLCAYGARPLAQRAAVRALFGEAAIGGRLPVSLPGLYPLGHGLAMAPRKL
jgi:beta-N-acetylhexosaminidase